MNESSVNTLMIGGTALAGGVAGTWAGAKLGATYGLRLGPWAAVTGAVLGALACAALTNRMGGAMEEAAVLEADEA